MNQVSESDSRAFLVYSLLHGTQLLLELATRHLDQLVVGPGMDVGGIVASCPSLNEVALVQRVPDPGVVVGRRWGSG